MGNIIVPYGPLLTHQQRLVSGGAETQGILLVAGVLKSVSGVAVCLKVFCERPRRVMQKWLFTMFMSLAGPQGPLKPESENQAAPEPCTPSKATMSVSVRAGRPFFIVVSISSHPPAALGKLASIGPVFDADAAFLPAKKVVPLQVIEAPLFLMPHPSALSSHSTQKSALLSLLKIRQLGLIELVALLQASVSAWTKSSRPLLFVLEVSMEPSQPPMQSWKAARRNFLIQMLKSGLGEKKQLSMVCNILSISAPEKPF